MPRKASELNALAVSRLSEPGLYFVGGVPGLALQVLDSGARTWILRVVIAGRRRDMGLGGYSVSGMTLARAREAAIAARDKIKQGIDPIEEAKAARSALASERAAAKTFEQCAAQYIEAHESTWRNAKHRWQWSSTLEQLAYPVIGKLLVRDVAKEHILEVLRPIWHTRNETASRLRGRIELVLSYAMQAGYRPEGLNPARWRGGLDKLLAPPNKVAKVEHYKAMPIGEVGAFMVKLRAAEGVGARALELVILTATRSGEVRGARWSEIDLERAVWVIPSDRMKAGKEHRIPLSIASVELLKATPRTDGSDYVFPGRTSGVVSDMTLLSVLRRMNAGVVVHGFRSTFRDWVSERTNYPGDLAEAALAHTLTNKVEAAYKRTDLFEKRRAMMAAWATFLSKVDPKAKSGTVTPIGAKRAG